MSNLEIAAVILALVAATLLTRASFFVLSAVRLPERLQRGLRYAPAAALAAIVLPDLMVSGGVVNLTLANPKLLAGLGATAFFLLTRHLLGTIVFGMIVFTLLRVLA